MITITNSTKLLAKESGSEECFIFQFITLYLEYLEIEGYNPWKDEIGQEVKRRSREVKRPANPVNQEFENSR